jgi:hypothetical protein
MLVAGLGGFFHGFLGLLLGANEENLAALATGGREKITGRLQLRERFAQVDDVNPVTRLEDELLHLGIPALGLVPKMDTRLQQFFKANTQHNIFLWLKVRASANHPAEHGIVFDVVVARRLHSKAAT